ncbi:MAG: type II toxin-antitoxin system PemK/MazF family toxin [Acidobacteriota bacterium]|nr:type II toxin-antitoxin system PemK/MazF family toxin [Acidobacteriota bacterium]
MTQSDVYWYKFKEPNKERPVLILTRTDLIPLLNVVTIAEITTTSRDNDSEVWLDQSDGMREECAVNLTNIQTVSKAKIGAYITHLSNKRMFEVREAVGFVFNFKIL